MKKSACLLFLALSVSLLAACGGRAGTAPPPETDSPAPVPEGAVARCRIVDGAGEGTLLLAEEGGSLMRLGAKNADFAVRADGGYIDRENLYWEDGCLFSLTGSAEDGFGAQKWASGTGAYFFSDCTARMAPDGSWTYEVGAEAIS